MPNLSQEQPSPSQRKPYRDRATAESFGVDAERYNRARPGYPDALVQRIVAAVGPGGRVLDVGCGTGIVARQLLDAGVRVLGVDADARMAAFARSSGVDVEVAPFETWDPAGREFDGVVAGQAWHWVDPVAGAAKAAQVLRPGGLLAIFGHVYDPPGEVAEPVAEVAEGGPAGPGAAPRDGRTALDIYRAMFEAMADGIGRAGGFAEPDRWHFDWQRSYTRDEWLDLVPTTGALTRVAPDELAGVLERVGAAIDRMGGVFVMHYITLALAAVRAPT
jgi:SAM-dependent methyltransferase